MFCISPSGARCLLCTRGKFCAPDGLDAGYEAVAQTKGRNDHQSLRPQSECGGRKAGAAYSFEEEVLGVEISPSEDEVGPFPEDSGVTEAVTAGA